MTYGGFIVIVVSILTFIVEFIRMLHIARLPQVSVTLGDSKKHKLVDNELLE